MFSFIKTFGKAPRLSKATTGILRSLKGRTRVLASLFKSLKKSDNILDKVKSASLIETQS